MSWFSVPRRYSLSVYRLFYEQSKPRRSARSGSLSEIRPGRRSPRDGSPLIEKMIDHDVRVLIFGMGREVAIKRGIGILLITTTNRHDFQRTVLLAPLLDQINRVRKPG